VAKQHQQREYRLRCECLFPLIESREKITCCEDGDFCLSNGLCRYSHSEVGGSGFYAGGCSDKAYKDSSCPALCSKVNQIIHQKIKANRLFVDTQGKPDAVYSMQEHLWYVEYAPIYVLTLLIIIAGNAAAVTQKASLTAMPPQTIISTPLFLQISKHYIKPALVPSAHQLPPLLLPQAAKDLQT
jgi:hypothetical protein